MIMLWPPYRRRVLAEADELMEYYGNQALNAAARLRLTAHENHEYRKARFYRRVGKRLQRFIDQDARIEANLDARRQERYDADIAHSEMLDRVLNNKTLQ